MINEHEYLTNIPDSAKDYGLCKVLLVRRELIHIKHIFTEVFCRKTIDIENELSKVNLSLINYMEIMTHRMRHITKLSRQFDCFIPDINGIEKTHFFPYFNVVSKLNTIISLDFDGVCTKDSFRDLYQLCSERCNNLTICSANPSVNNNWFTNNCLDKPSKIYSCKGKIKKLKKLIELSQKYDFVFHVDDEEEYLKFAWLFGVQTYQFKQRKIVYYTRKTQ